MKKLLAFLLSSSLILTSLAPHALAKDEKAAMTREEVVTYLLNVADDYNPGLKKEDILKGDAQGKTKGGEYVSRTEALIMLSRAFSDLPKPQGNDLRSLNTASSFSDIPVWAQAEMTKIAATGIVNGYTDGKLGAKDQVTLEQLTALVKRMVALKGTNPRDDYYEFVNKKWLNASTIDAGEMTNGAFNELDKQNQERIKDMLQEVVKDTHAKGSVEQKIADFYTNAQDLKHRNALGIKPIAPYIASLNQASTIQEVMNVGLKMEKELGFGSILSFGIMADAKKSDINALYYAGVGLILDKTSYVSNNAQAKKVYVSYLSKLYQLVGDSKEVAEKKANSLYEFEKQIAAATMDIQDQNDVNKYYNPYTIQDFDALFPSLDMANYLKQLQLGSVDKIIVMDKGQANKLSQLMTDEHVQDFKNYMQAIWLINTSSVLSEELQQASLDFQANLFGIQGQKTQDEIAIQLTQSVMSDYLGQMFAKRHFTAEAKQDVEKMVKEFIAVYKERIKALDWMSETTKAKAMLKLDKMTYKIGYPDKWDDRFKDVSIVSIKEGGTLFDNFVAIRKASWKTEVATLGQPVDKSKWQMSVYNVNAYYNALNNEIVFPAGILQAPFYDINAKHETNLGAIGMVIAHEISHAFDNLGSSYDENGNAVNWWTPEDYKKFQEKTERVISYYNGLEVIPGVYNNGSLTVSENIADLGGMAASLQVLSQTKNADYKAYFEGYATIWRTTMSKEVVAYLSSNDTHSANKIRVNRTVASFKEFYDTYGITEKDTMYVAPEQRVSIW
ncbi:M13-type metalloendopeptidase [Paenibacillus sp. sgz500992]|uniref:M13-type metalloendopeptidase n=1 Tax=Paenibacillus sp. sgz500992 TaxID=3242476 RepID=UPI0036D2E68E